MLICGSSSVNLLENNYKKSDFKQIVFNIPFQIFNKCREEARVHRNGDMQGIIHTTKTLTLCNREEYLK